MGMDQPLFLNDLRELYEKTIEQVEESEKSRPKVANEETTAQKKDDEQEETSVRAGKKKRSRKGTKPQEFHEKDWGFILRMMELLEGYKKVEPQNYGEFVEKLQKIMDGYSLNNMDEKHAALLALRRDFYGVGMGY